MNLSFSISFSSTDDLIDFAKRFLIDDRLNSLENDIYRCLPRDGNKKETTRYAPFPALLYCFSIVDLLGGLYAGNSRSGNTTKNSEIYMENFLNYTPDKIFLLQKLYRHKVVHLSQPKSVIRYNKQNIAWRHDENQRSKHLTIDPTPGIVDLYGKGNISCDCQFLVSIWQLNDDIKNSVVRQSDGYIEKLRTDANLQNKFVTAINDIFNPSIIN